MKRLIFFLLSFTIGYILLVIPSLTFAADQHQSNVDAAASADLNQQNYQMGEAQELNVDEIINPGSISITADAVSCGLTGCPTSDHRRIVGVGALPEMQMMVAQLIIEPPVQPSYYIADLLHNGGFIAQPAYAQGIGFSALSPVLQVWKAFRNLAYFLFILIFIVIGIMIMFRAQLNPQTVVTVQAALPKIIITLIMITFSYAIAGLMIDLIYLLFFVATSLLETFGILNSATATRNVLFGYSIFTIGFKYLISPWEAGGSAARSAGNLFSSAVGIPALLQGISSSIFYLIIAVAIVIAMFRTLFALLIAWISIILGVVFAPLQLLLNAVPGTNTFSSWLRSLAANAFIFPAVGIMLVVGIALTGSTSEQITGVEPGQFGIHTQPPTGGSGGTGWVPPLVTTNPSRTGSNQVSALIGIGMIMILPELIKLIKKAFAVQEGGVGEIIQGGLQRGVGPVTAPFKTVGGFGKRYVGTSFLSGAYIGATSAEGNVLSRIGGGISGGFKGLSPKAIFKSGVEDYEIQRYQKDYYKDIAAQKSEAAEAKKKADAMAANNAKPSASSQAAVDSGASTVKRSA